MKIEVTEYPEILERVKAIGGAVFESKDYDMNIIGERNPNGTPNVFDDWIHVLFKVDGEWNWYSWKCTTDAGLHYLHISDTAILVHNRQYRGAYTIGLHRGQYEALVQRGNKVSIWRDRNRDGEHDYAGEEISGYFGINIHRASSRQRSEFVERYSAGCQVFASPTDYAEFLSIVKQQIEKLGYEKFSYTLLLGK
jgi:hypothetical protein